ncbi:MAG: cytochrome c biogenesis protein CcdA [Thermoplasmata archaeon]
MRPESCHEPPSDIEKYSEEKQPDERFQTLIFISIFLSLISILVVGSLVPYFFTSQPEKISLQEGEALIYFNEACGECALYIDTELIPTLQDGGIVRIQKKDYINERSYRAELSAINEQLGVPSHLQSHIATFVQKNVTFAFEGHVPEHVILDLMMNSSTLNLTKILVYQEEMRNPTTYIAWGFEGETREYAIDTPISDFLLWFGQTSPSGSSEASLLPLVLVTGLLDGINPCAFAVLLFFITFLFVIRRTRGNVARMGAVYVLSIFFVYFFIGIGLLRAIILSGQPHLLAYIGSSLILVLGTLSILQYFFPNLPLTFKMPEKTWTKVKDWIFKATLPSTLVAGLLVGLCTFPCSGGIYVAVLTLMASQTTYFEGVGYLYLYNLMFVLPLILILAFTSNRFVARKLVTWERSNKRIVTLFSGIVMILLGVAFLLFLI